MTPRELRDAIEVAAQRDREALDRDLAHAWHAAVFHVTAGVGKLPPLPEVLQRSRAAQRAAPLTVAQQRAQLAMVSERIGIPIRPASPETLAALARLRERMQQHG